MTHDYTQRVSDPSWDTSQKCKFEREERSLLMKGKEFIPPSADTLQQSDCRLFSSSSSVTQKILYSRIKEHVPILWLYAS